MCRLLGLTAGTTPVRAMFWLLDAPDSLEAQGRRNPDGSGLGFFDRAGGPVLDKQPESAGRRIHSRGEAGGIGDLVAHVRRATAGGRTVPNTHPSPCTAASWRTTAGSVRWLGGTDSERYFALITQQADAHDGDLGAAITAAAGGSPPTCRSRR